MSVRIMSEVWKLPCPTHTVKLVLLALADNSNDEGLCWPSVRNLAAKCDLSERSVQEQIESITQRGWLKVERGGGNTSNRYQFTLTGERRSPLNAVHQGGEPGAGGGVNGVQGRGERRSTEPSLNHHIQPSIQPSPAEEPPLPACLNTDRFKLAWSEWYQHRREKRKPMTPLAAKHALSKLASWGEERAVNAICFSIANSYQGIFEQNNQKGTIHEDRRIHIGICPDPSKATIRRIK